MEQSNRIQRSEVWEQIYKIVKQIPQADTNGCDAPDAPSVATELEELVKKLFKHFVQSADFIDFTREYGIKGWKELDKWLEQNVK